MAAFKVHVLQHKNILFFGFCILIIFLVVPGFLAIGNINNLILRSVPVLAVAVGQTFVLLIAGIDLSVGSVLALSTAIASSLMQYNLALGAGASLLAGLVFGSLNGLAVTKLKVNPFLVTLSTAIIIGGIALYIRPYPGGIIPIEFVNFITFRFGIVPINPILFFLFISGTGIVMLRKSLFGRHLYAIGGNREAARLAGINADFVVVLTYMLSSLFAALGGLYMAARMGCGDPNVGVPFQMESITAAVLGGTALTGGKGGVLGTVFGVILVVMLGNIFNLVNFNIYWQQVIRGLILLMVVGYSEFKVMQREELKLKKMIA